MRGRKGLGVEPLATSIRFSFTLNGVMVRETINKAPTPPNLKWANRHAADLRRAIANGTFRYVDFFPDSKRIGATGDGTLGHYCDLYVKSIGGMAANTRKQYRNAITFWRGKLKAETPIADILHSKLKAEIGGHPWPSWRLHNNYLIPLRGVFAMAKADGALRGDPMAGIKSMRRVVDEDAVEPWTEDEEASILSRLREPSVFNYFDFAFAEGMRPEELIELDWARDVNLKAGTVKVQKVKSAGEVRAPKNNKVRVVELSARGIAALKRQEPLTRLKPHGKVFENPNTGSPWSSAEAQRKAFWAPALKAARLPYRVPYTTRHTCATRMLAQECNPAWCAKQLGHTKEMFFRTYAKWIEGADRGAEVAKRNLPAFFHEKTGS